MRILSNVTFLFVSLSYTAESAIVTAFITFIPKFIESQFGIPASSASIYTGELRRAPEGRRRRLEEAPPTRVRAEQCPLEAVCCPAGSSQPGGH